MLDRRNFIRYFGSATAASWLAPLAAHAQQGGLRRVGWLSGGSAGDPQRQRDAAAFREGMRTHGWEEGHNYRLDIRFAGADTASMQALAKDLIASRPEVILTNPTPPTAALLRETKVVPIVFVNISDPLGSGFVASLARPGGNATGFTNYESTFGGKWIEVLRDIAPAARRAGVIFDPRTAVDGGQYFLKPMQSAAVQAGIELVPLPASDIAELERAIAGFARKSNGGLAVIPDVFTAQNRMRLAELAIRHRLPSVGASRFMPEGGLLAGYGIQTGDLYRRAASYVDRILKGEKAADLPVQAPTKFELVVNLRTAKAIGLTIPETFLLRADEVIE